MHGLVTAQGIGITSRAAVKMNWCTDETVKRIIHALSANSLPDECSKFKAANIARTAKSLELKS